VKPPICRAGEPDWYAAMDRPLSALRAIDHQGIPILCAGDIFDKWKSPPELINFAIERLPKMIAIPGQHDLPMHDVEQIHRSAFGTLVAAGKLNCPENRFALINGARVWTFPWNARVTPLPEDYTDERSRILNIAVIHEYRWIDGHGYTGAPAAGRFDRWPRSWKGYDVVVIGDNHSGFVHTTSHGTAINCGTMMRRKTDEASYEPTIGLIHANGDVSQWAIDTSEDVIETAPLGDATGTAESIQAFLSQLEVLQTTDLDFADALRQALDRIDASPELRAVVTGAMNDG